MEDVQAGKRIIVEGKGKFVWPRKIPAGKLSHVECSCQKSNRACWHVLQLRNHLDVWTWGKDNRAACCVVIIPGQKSRLKIWSQAVWVQSVGSFQGTTLPSGSSNRPVSPRTHLTCHSAETSWCFKCEVSEVPIIMNIFLWGLQGTKD